MALIHKKLVTDRETASYKLDRVTVELVRAYSEFIGSPQEHVVNEALLYLFRKDKAFSAWLKSNKADLTAVDDSPGAHRKVKQEPGRDVLGDGSAASGKKA